MKRKILGLGLLAAGLILAIALTGCPNGNGGVTEDPTQIGAIQVSPVGNDIAFGGTRTLSVTRSGGTTEIDWTSSSNAITITAPATGTQVTITAGTAAATDVVITATVRGTNRTQTATFSVVEPQQLQSLSFQSVGAEINILAGSSATTLTVVPYPAGADVGTITWAPSAGGDVWVVPNPNNQLQATVHAGNNVTAAPVQVTASTSVAEVSPASVNVNVTDGQLGLRFFQVGDPPAETTPSMPAPDDNGRFVIHHPRGTGGWNNAFGLIQNNFNPTFVHISEPSAMDWDTGGHTQTRWSARVRIAEIHRDMTGATIPGATGFGVIVGMFDNPAAPEVANAIRWGGLRIQADDTMVYFSSRGSQPGALAASTNQLIPNMTSGAPVGTEYLITVIRNPEGPAYTFEVRDRLGNHPQTGAVGGFATVNSNAATQLPEEAFFGFAISGATVEISQIRVYSGGPTLEDPTAPFDLIFETGDTEPTVPPENATEVTLAIVGPSTVAPGTSVVVNATVLPATLTNRDVSFTVDPPTAIVGTPTGTSVTVTRVDAGTVTVTATSEASPNVPSDPFVITFDDQGPARLPLGAEPWVFEGVTDSSTLEGNLAAINSQLPDGIMVEANAAGTGFWRWRPGAGQGLEPNGTGRYMVFSADFVNASATITLYVSGTHGDNVVNAERLATHWDIPVGDLTVTAPWNAGTAGRNTVVIDVTARTTELRLNWPWSGANGADPPGRLSLLSINRTTP